MKKGLLVVFVGLMMITSLFTGCSGEEEAQKTDFKPVKDHYYKVVSYKESDIDKCVDITLQDGDQTPVVTVSLVANVKDAGVYNINNTALPQVTEDTFDYTNANLVRFNESLLKKLKALGK